MLTMPSRSGLEEDFPSSLTHCLGLLHLQGRVYRIMAWSLSLSDGKRVKYVGGESCLPSCLICMEMGETGCGPAQTMLPDYSLHPNNTRQYLNLLSIWLHFGREQKTFEDGSGI